MYDPSAFQPAGVGAESRAIQTRDNLTVVGERETECMITADELWPRLDASGEDEVRKNLATEAYGQREIPLINEGLARRDRQRQDAANRDRDAREDETRKLSVEVNAIASEGNAISRRSNIAAWVAVVSSAVALFVAISTAVIDASK